MSSNTKYSDPPNEIARGLDRAVIISDFLPSPSELVFKARKQKVTINLSERSVSNFKRYAKSHNAKYQTMISDIVDAYSLSLK